MGKHTAGCAWLADRISKCNCLCQHKLTKESQKCKHNLYFGTTCDVCCEICAKCREMYG